MCHIKLLNARVQDYCLESLFMPFHSSDQRSLEGQCRGLNRKLLAFICVNTYQSVLWLYEVDGRAAAREIKNRIWWGDSNRGWGWREAAILWGPQGHRACCTISLLALQWDTCSVLMPSCISREFNVSFCFILYVCFCFILLFLCVCVYFTLSVRMLFMMARA